ncbi:GNAT family N-acetyltransferase [Mucilaginibacter pallidiroseus]|uniref:GNAT family N-acetyltransferase n=1 Tax=Mucilaginibacter pallidiroseus TaxID=2599295 RepID=A0A563TZG5_9SPHI|nr:GNAT family N-acetyltransferase [Mucilaginibacter pallidiroseus]TWR24765.1 GNAT family N-acetyltransferase [Mucilaginibacter pallidiroseus]
MNYPIEPLHSGLNKKEFTCGKEMLDNYLHKQASQDIKRRLSTVSVMLDGDRIIGYYTLSSTSIPRELVPEQVQKKMPPSYHNLPAILLGRLALDQNYKGQRLGEYLLIDALKKCYNVSLTHVGAMAVIVDPLDAEAEAFYLKYDFVKLDSGKMFLTMQTIAALFAE